MKRHAALIPLSHDHHHGLVLAQRLKRGYSKSARSDWPTDPEEQKERVKVFYLEELVPHFEVEEQHVFPMARGAFPDSDEVVERLLEQHRRIAVMVEKIQSEGGVPLHKEMEELGSLLENHIRLEERSLFEGMQNSLTEEHLQELGKTISASRSGQERKLD